MLAALYASFPEVCNEIAEALGRGLMSLLEPAGVYVFACVHAYTGSHVFARVHAYTRSHVPRSTRTCRCVRLFVCVRTAHTHSHVCARAGPSRVTTGGPDGETVLMRHSATGYAAMVGLLLGQGAPPNAQDKVE